LPAWNAGIITAQCRSTETMAKAPLWHSETGPLHGPVRRAPGRPMVQARGVDFWFRSDGQGMENPVYRQSLLLQGTLPMYSISWSLSLSASANRAAGHLRKPPTSSPWPKDCLRHIYGSYHLANFSTPVRTSTTAM
jgi:hypothetical protein